MLELLVLPLATLTLKVWKPLRGRGLQAYHKAAASILSEGAYRKMQHFSTTPCVDKYVSVDQIYRSVAGDLVAADPVAVEPDDTTEAVLSLTNWRAEDEV